ncbi:hypothetical protein Lal_00022193 [Lupinus albus]|nr:hypothetical protein Lal_00022193 [Lupinus albus]
MESILTWLVDKLAQLTTPNSQFPPQPPPHGSSPSCNIKPPKLQLQYFDTGINSCSTLINSKVGKGSLNHSSFVLAHLLLLIHKQNSLN